MRICRTSTITTSLDTEYKEGKLIMILEHLKVKLLFNQTLTTLEEMLLTLQKLY